MGFDEARPYPFLQQPRWNMPFFRSKRDPILLAIRPSCFHVASSFSSVASLSRISQHAMDFQSCLPVLAERKHSAFEWYNHNLLEGDVRAAPAINLEGHATHIRRSCSILLLPVTCAPPVTVVLRVMDALEVAPIY
eukprot:scaffold1137_cov392-Pavlova_lutheri.AAC.24